MGDMPVKSGDWRTAQKVYANAKLSPDYTTWKLLQRAIVAFIHFGVMRREDSCILARKAA
jgi:hypothetical protein